jgi:glycosyltransferase involved in cell wall biosynthesis
MKMQSICLTMIAKNESAVIEHLLNSVSFFVDSVALVDTGSVDGTVEIVRRWCSARDKQFAQKISLWRNDFAFHRNEAVELARTILPRDGFFLFLDADEIVIDGISELPRYLRSYDVIGGWLCQRDFWHRKNMLVRSSAMASFVGEFHEIATFTESAAVSMCQELRVFYGDNGHRRKSNNYIDADISALRKALRGRTADHRLRWLYARTLEAAGRFDSARSAFRFATRIARTLEEQYAGAWGDARCARRRRQVIAAKRGYSLMNQLMPSRAEGWIGLAQLAFEEKRFAQALHYCAIASQCALPRDTMMFDRAAYSWLWREIAANALVEIGEAPHVARRLVAEAIASEPEDAVDRERLERSCKALLR